MTAALAMRDLIRAYDAFARKDCLTATQLALRAAHRRSNPPEVRCDAYMLLTLTALLLDSPEGALSYAVGANLLAYKLDDEEVEQQAEAILDLVLAQYPELSTASDMNQEH
ncbi:MAG: hypothetical protein ACOY94_27200 [Bacillota bacterium]